MRWIWLVALVACGGEEISSAAICGRLASWDTASRQGTCSVPELKNLWSEPHCNAGIAACSDSDLIGLRSYVDCLDSLQPCAKEYAVEYQGMLLGCDNILTFRVRPSCSSKL